MDPEQRGASSRRQKSSTGDSTIKTLLADRPTSLLPAQPSANAEWNFFQDNLGSTLADLCEDEFLIVSRKESRFFVQFVGEGRFGMRAEAVSDAYLEAPLPTATVARLLELGWNRPTNLPEAIDPEGHTPDGSPNFSLDIAYPVPFAALSALAVTTLREGFQVPHPGKLQYKSFSRRGDQIRFPLLRIARESP